MKVSERQIRKTGAALRLRAQRGLDDTASPASRSSRSDISVAMRHQRRHHVPRAMKVHQLHGRRIAQRPRRAQHHRPQRHAERQRHLLQHGAERARAGARASGTSAKASVLMAV
jgi:hypothetical protein